MTKTCKHCGLTKPAEAFPKHKRYRDGLSSRCKECTNAYARDWKRGKRPPWVLHAEELATKGLKQCSKCRTVLPLSDFNSGEHTGRICRSCRAEYLRQYRKDNQEYLSLKEAIKRHGAGKEKVRSQAAKRYRKRVSTTSGRLKQRLASYKSSAKTKGIPWELTDEQALRMFQCECFYCWAPPSPLNGIDKLDPKKGYVDGNVVPCCWPCNEFKSDRTLSQMLAWVAQFLENGANNVRTLILERLAEIMATTVGQKTAPQ